MTSKTPTPLPGSGLVPQDAFDRFSLIVNGPALFNAIVTAIDLSIFSILETQPGVGQASLSNQVDVAPEKIRVLMFSLSTTGLVRKMEGGYANTDLASAFLAHERPDSWTHILRGWHRLYYPAFGELTHALREGRNLALDRYPGDEQTLYARLQHSPELDQILHRSMSAFTLQSMSGLLEHADLNSVHHLLDIGGGDGTTALALVERYPDLLITILDIPSVATQAIKLAAHDRITVVGCDVFESAFPSGIDAVLFSHFLEVFAADQIQLLLDKAYTALRPGGSVFVYGFNASPDEADGIYSARLALYLTALATGEGMTYPSTDYEAWMCCVGFEDVSTVVDLPYEHGLTSGRKAGDGGTAP